MFTKKILSLLLLSIILVSMSAAADSSENDCIYYFYSQDCLDCQSMEKYFSSLEDNYPSLNIQKFEVYHNYKNYLSLQDYFKSYNVKDDSRYIPVVFIGNSYFVGKESITSFLEERVKDNSGSECPSAAVKEAVGIIGLGEPSNVLRTLTFSRITADAVKNIFNPGIIALLLVMAALLSGSRTVVKKGSLYILGVYSGYFLFALGLFTYLYNSQINFFFYKIIGLSAVILGLAGIRNFLGTWNDLLEKIPADLRKYWERTADFIHSSLGFYLSGLLLSLFTFASVSESFFLMRNIFTSGFMRGAVLPLVLYYLLVLILVFAAALAGFNSIKEKLNFKVEKRYSSDESKEKSKKHYNNLVNFAARIVVLVVGLILLFV